jgi:hypothetical protein
VTYRTISGQPGGGVTARGSRGSRSRADHRTVEIGTSIASPDTAVRVGRCGAHPCPRVGGGDASALAHPRRKP